MDSFIKKAVEKNIKWKELLLQNKRHYIWDNNVENFNKLLPQDKPSIMFFKAENTDKKKGCILIIPGGCYLYKSTNEAVNVAEKITEKGINAAILDYRLFPYERDVILLDAIRAIKYLRYYKEDFNIDDKKISVIGFSAGGNLATLASLNQEAQDKTKKDKIDAQSSEINALGLCYAAVYENEDYMIFDDENAKKYFKIDYEKINSNFPPTFIWHSFSDTLVDPRVSLNFAKKLNASNVPVELHMFPYGMHGQGLANTTKGELNEGDNVLTSCWMDLFIRWLNFYGF